MSESSAMFKCDGCERQYQWKVELAGKKLKCKCGALVTVPLNLPDESTPNLPSDSKPVESVLDSKRVATIDRDGRTSIDASARTIADALLVVIIAVTMAILSGFLLYKHRKTSAMSTLTLSEAGMITAALMIWFRSTHAKAKTLLLVAAACYGAALCANLIGSSTLQRVLSVPKPIGLMAFFIGLYHTVSALGNDDWTLRGKLLMQTVAIYAVSLALLVVVILMANANGSGAGKYFESIFTLSIVSLVIWVIALMRMIGFIGALKRGDNVVNGDTMARDELGKSPDLKV